MLRVDRTSQDFAFVKRDLESVLGLLQRLKEADAADTGESQTGPRNPMESGGDADARLNELRADVAIETPADAVLRHAPPGRREGSFFKVSEDS